MRSINKKKRKKAASRCARWRRKNPAKVARDNARRRKRRDRRDKHGVWGVRLRLLMLHCGIFHDRKRDQYYEGVEVRLTIIELARLWFRDCAWMMKDPHCDRIDADGHYEFTNCRFIECAENLARITRAGNGREPGEDG